MLIVTGDESPNISDTIITIVQNRKEGYDMSLIALIWADIFVGTGVLYMVIIGG